MKGLDLREFKYALGFLGKFIAIYLLASMIYAGYISYYKPLPDPVTRWVTIQATTVVRLFDTNVTMLSLQNKPTVSIRRANQGIISVYEGCNGLNMIIIFIAFLVAFGPLRRSLLLFTVFGMSVIHTSNILRISALYFVTTNYPHYQYFVHKYLFTATIYAVIFMLWLLWVNCQKKIKVEGA